MRAVFLAILIAGMLAPVARAAEPEISLTSREVYKNVPFELTLTLHDVETYEEPQMPPVPGLLFTGPSVMRQESASLVGGQFRRSVSVDLRYTVVAQREGTIEIPPITILADEQEWTSNPIEITVRKPDGGDLLIVEVASDTPRAYLGQFVGVRLRIWIRPYEQEGLTLSAQTMWSRLDLNRSQWGDFAQALGRLLAGGRRSMPARLEPRNTDEGMADYYLYEVETDVRAEQLGPLSLAPITVIMDYPQRLVRNRLGGWDVRDQRLVIASAAAPDVDVEPLPDEGRPAGFRGAVGRYTISADAEPTSVAVADPITLTLRIFDRTDGPSRLELLQPPDLASVDALTESFRVPDGALAGVVAGRQKTFTQTIRALRDDVTEIPPVPFSFFDTDRGRYVTIWTEPIPIEVAPATTLAMSDVVGAGPVPETTSQLTEVAGGILANHLGDGVLVVTAPSRPGAAHLLVLLAPPVVFTVAAVGQRRSRRLRNDRGYVRRRRARRAALQRLEAGANGALADGVAAALSGYVADRCNLPEGALTAAEVVEHLRRRDVDADLVRQVGSILSECEAQRYAPSVGSSGDGIAKRARACIDRLERERLG